MAISTALSHCTQHTALHLTQIQVETEGYGEFHTIAPSGEQNCARNFRSAAKNVVLTSAGSGTAQENSMEPRECSHHQQLSVFITLI
jgi:hypothetical protein